MKRSSKNLRSKPIFQPINHTSSLNTRDKGNNLKKSEPEKTKNVPRVSTSPKAILQKMVPSSKESSQQPGYDSLHNTNNNLTKTENLISDTFWKSSKDGCESTLPSTIQKFPLENSSKKISLINSVKSTKKEQTNINISVVSPNPGKVILKDVSIKNNTIKKNTLDKTLTRNLPTKDNTKNSSKKNRNSSKDQEFKGNSNLAVSDNLIDRPVPKKQNNKKNLTKTLDNSENIKREINKTRQIRAKKNFKSIKDNIELPTLENKENSQQKIGNF